MRRLRNRLLYRYREVLTQSASGKAIRKLTLSPILSTESGTPAVEELLKACAPATFGSKGEEVLEESYRKAVKLDSN